MLLYGLWTWVSKQWGKAHVAEWGLDERQGDQRDSNSIYVGETRIWIKAGEVERTLKMETFKMFEIDRS